VLLGNKSDTLFLDCHENSGYANAPDFFDLCIIPVFNNTLHYTLMQIMNHFEPIRTKAKFTQLYYYKNYNNNPYKNIFTIFDDETWGQKNRAHFC
jgi:hypothetical protein